MKVDEIKKELKKFNAPIYGSKAVLIERLLAVSKPLISNEITSNETQESSDNQQLLDSALKPDVTAPEVIGTEEICAVVTDVPKEEEISISIVAEVPQISENTVEITEKLNENDKIDEKSDKEVSKTVDDELVDYNDDVDDCEISGTAKSNVDLNLRQDENEACVNDSLLIEQSGSIDQDSIANDSAEVLQTPIDAKKKLLEEKELKSKLLLLKQKKVQSPRVNTSVSVPDDGFRSKYVRVDNLQRPLNIKGFHSWLSDILNPTDVDIDLIWINSIKTHCYINFNSIEDASLCVSRLTGLKYPSSSTLALEVNYTAVSALEAAKSVEAQQKPGQWKSQTQVHANAPAIITNAPYAPSDKRINSSPRSSAFDIMKKAAEKAADSALKVRQVDNVNASNNSNSGKKIEEIRLKRSIDNVNARDSVDNNQSVRNSSNFNQHSNQIHNSLNNQDQRAKRARQEHNDDKRFNKTQVEAEEMKSLDQFFRKTKALPELYWLPMSSDVVKQRILALKSKR